MGVRVPNILAHVLRVAKVKQAGALDHALPRLALQRIPLRDRLVCEVGLVWVQVGVGVEVRG